MNENRCQCSEWGCHNCTPAERVHSHGHNRCEEQAEPGTELCTECTTEERS